MSFIKKLGGGWPKFFCKGTKVDAQHQLRAGVPGNWGGAPRDRRAVYRADTFFWHIRLYVLAFFLNSDDDEASVVLQLLNKLLRSRTGLH